MGEFISTKDAREVVEGALASEKKTGLEGAVQKFTKKHALTGNDLEYFKWVAALLLKKGAQFGRQKGYASAIHAMKKEVPNV